MIREWRGSTSGNLPFGSLSFSFRSIRLPFDIQFPDHDVVRIHYTAADRIRNQLMRNILKY
jgi:hypothetical protein